MNNFERYLEQFYGDGIFSEATDLQFEETNLEFSQTEKVLLYFLSKDKKMNMGQIVETLHIPNSTANYVVNKLKKKDLLKSEKNPEDRRIIEVYITEKGKEANKRILSNLQKRFNIIISKGLEILNKRIDDDDMKIVKKAINELFGSL